MWYERWGTPTPPRVVRPLIVVLGLVAVLCVSLAMHLASPPAGLDDVDLARLPDDVLGDQLGGADLTPLTPVRVSVDRDVLAVDLPAAWLPGLIDSRLDLEALVEPDGPGSGDDLGLRGDLHPRVVVVGGRFPTSLSVWHVTHAGGADVVAALRTATERREGGRFVARRRITTAAGPADRLEFAFRHAPAASRVFYVVRRGGAAWILRYTTTDIAGLGPLGDRMAASFGFLARTLSAR